jgi:hypothetical protein
MTILQKPNQAGQEEITQCLFRAVTIAKQDQVQSSEALIEKLIAEGFASDVAEQSIKLWARHLAA